MVRSPELDYTDDLAASLGEPWQKDLRPNAGGTPHGRAGADHTFSGREWLLKWSQAVSASLSSAALALLSGCPAGAG